VVRANDLGGTVKRAALVICLVMGLGATTASAKPTCSGKRATIAGAKKGLRAPGHRRVFVGTKRKDVIVGTNHADWIVGAGGRDVICGGGGNDYVFGGDWSRPHDRHTKLIGGPGNDYIGGGYAGDRIEGGAGRDRIDGEFGNDRIEGGRGDDFIRSQVGSDRITMGPGDDHLEASSGDDLVHGGPGADQISTGPGADVVFGGAGTDEIHLLWGNDLGHGGNGDDALQGGPGEDLCKGGAGIDTASTCEHRRSIEGTPPASALNKALAHHHGRHHRHHHHRGPRPFDRVRAVRDMKRFLHALQRRKAIKTPSATTRQLERSAELSSEVKRIIQRRYQGRLRHTGRAEAVLKKSVERYRLRLLLSAISDQIDRLRWTPMHGDRARSSNEAYYPQ
jgi:hemolysin type calcium-binding protein